MVVLQGNLSWAGFQRMGFRDSPAIFLKFIYCLNHYIGAFQYCTWVVHALACEDLMHEVPADGHGETWDEATELVQFRLYRAAFVLYCIPLSGGLL